MKQISSLQHPLVKHWYKLKNDAKYRKETNRVLIEGKNSIQDLARKDLILRLATLEPHPEIAATETFIISASILQKISSVETSDGIIAELERPEYALKKHYTRLVVLDRIQDPGNLGTIIRSAHALGWDGVFLLPGCTDPFSSKALRSTKGAAFLLPIVTGSWQELVDLCEKESLAIVIADTDGKQPSSIVQTKIALVLGNEGQGAEPPESVPHDKVTIAMKEGCDSLNVACAASILLYCLQGSHKERLS